MRATSRTPPSDVRSQAVILIPLRRVRGRFRLPNRGNALFARLVYQAVLNLRGGGCGAKTTAKRRRPERLRRGFMVLALDGGHHAVEWLSVTHLTHIC